MRHNRLRTLALFLSLIGVAAGPSTGPSTRPGADSFVREVGFSRGFRCSHYLRLAVDLQRLDPDRRVRRLREMAADDNSVSELFPLCRMLFDCTGGGEFRRPTIGGESFVGDTDPSGRSAYGRWPLDPITLEDGVPIMVSRGDFRLGGGRPETPAQYLNYCLAQCKWRETKFADADPVHIRKAVEAFIAARPSLPAYDVTWLRQQAD